MEIHRLFPAPRMAALLLLAAAAVICSSDASFDALGDSRREAHLEPADEAGHRTYIVLLEAPPAGSSMDADAARAWHQSFLPSMTTSLGEPRLRRSYQTVVHGFSARLTEDELEIVSAKPGFVRAFPNVIRYKETTLTPAFLGLEFPQPTAGKRFENWPGFGGLATIIGVIDGGIANAHPSMDDAGFEEIEVPERWSGSCHEDMKCNKKLIGARNFVGAGPPLDSPDGHGTHETTIAAGNFVAGANFRGLASGNASGMAPQAHVAVYKACGERSCTDEPLLAAIDAAVKDGVDVISLSVGGSSEPTYDHDPIAVGSFGAMRAGVLVVAAAGNGGPSPSTVHNDAPWLLTVGAGTVDRSLAAGVELDDTTEVNGQSLTNRQWQAANRPVLQHEVLYRQEGDRPNCVYPEDELPELVPDRVVICQAGGEMTGKNLEDLKSNNASAIILVDKEVFGHTGMVMEMAGMENTYTPLLQVTYEDGGILKSFASYSPRKPMVLIDFNRGTVVGGATPAPTVAFLSARGPSRYYPAILKPDVLAPGINILGGVPPYQAQPGGATEYFKFMSGTSMAVPHVSGAAVLLRCAHYDWGPAAIRSALMTTADIVDNSGRGIVDEQLNGADVYKMGAGHINVSRAMNPGLVYDLNERQYAAHVCSTLGEDALRAVARNDQWNCSELPTTHPSNLNYPSITVPLQPAPAGFSVVRTLRNVAPMDLGTAMEETYTAKVSMPPEVRVTVDPSTLTFTYYGQEASYQILVFSTDSFPVQGAVYQGTVEWSSNDHTVRSPMIAVVGLGNPQPSTAWKLD